MFAFGQYAVKYAYTKVFKSNKIGEIAGQHKFPQEICIFFNNLCD